MNNRALDLVAALVYSIPSTKSTHITPNKITIYAHFGEQTHTHVYTHTHTVNLPFLVQIRFISVFVVFISQGRRLSLNFFVQV